MRFALTASVDRALGGGFERGKFYDVVGNIDGMVYRVVLTLVVSAVKQGARVVWAETAGAFGADLMYQSFLLEVGDDVAEDDRHAFVMDRWLPNVSVVPVDDLPGLTGVLHACPVCLCGSSPAGEL